MRRLFILFSGVITAFFLAGSIYANTTHTASPYRELIRNYDVLFAEIYGALEDGMETLELAEYRLDTKDLIQIYSDVILASPELFYADSSVAYYYNARGEVMRAEFSYLMGEEERKAARKRYEQEVDYVVSLVDPVLSEAEKALFVHDYLIASYSYDGEEPNYDAYSMFLERRGVCQAYSLAYMAVLRELGMDVVMVTSDEMNHAWNLVSVDGSWYHVDLSFDDPSPDRTGRVLHENFLLDDEGIRQTPTPHYGWKSAIRCLSVSFAKPIWHGVESRMIWLDGQWYYIDPVEKSLAVSGFDGSGRADVYRFRDLWTADPSGKSYYVGVFSGLSELFGYLFVNTPYDIVIYNPGNGRTNVYLEFAGEQHIYGSDIYKNRLEYFLADSPDGGNSSIMTFEITDFSEDDFGTEMPFDDVFRLDPYYASVKFVYNRGLFRGVSATKFAPDAYLTRAMFVTVLGRLCNVDTELYAEVTFDDVENGQWYSPYVEWAAAMGIVNGVGDNCFDPLGEITHEQMYKIVAMCGEYLDAGIMETDHALILYEDRTEISDWAFRSVAYCTVNGLIRETSDRNLYPADRATRAEAADIISRFAVLCGKT